MIDSLEDALLLYDNAVAYQSKLQEELAAATERLQEAVQDVGEIKGCLGKADFELGRVRYIVRKNGFGEILTKKKHTKVDGNSDKFPEIYDLLMILGRNWFTVRLDWVDSVTI